MKSPGRVIFLGLAIALLLRRTGVVRNDKEHPGMDVWTDASATDGEVLVKAPHLERVRKTDVLTATGKVYYFGEKANLICEKAVIYRKESPEQFQALYAERHEKVRRSENVVRAAIDHALERA